ncbi:hypothetical protein Ae406Ps2_3034c [Pseudonocardia sp. Ae406_Ps2]|nr:hypothetical protein Ae331Ps2_2893 [Pseudonocardia sp. Ae331_Ps2]OLM03034.1 hypothetical protein Ae406Ps2_3034c [Pseudonocardia sp. Ae406_Ps2]
MQSESREEPGVHCIDIAHGIPRELRAGIDDDIDRHRTHAGFFVTNLHEQGHGVPPSLF